MGVQLTPGQRYLLDILQKKLIGTLQTYARLSREKRDLLQKLGEQQDYIVHDHELARLREKIKRISARQKRFTSQIINGNGNSTIPKECYFKALGLVTRETLNQINSKSSERRRRTTANPRFSHEAIQAKKALQKPRIDPRVAREKRNASSAAANSTATAGTTTSNSTSISTSTSASKQRNSNNNNNTNYANQESVISPKSKAELLEEFKRIHGLIESKAGQVRVKFQNKKRLDEENKALVTVLKKLMAANPSIVLELSDYPFADWDQIVTASLSQSTTPVSASASATSSSSSRTDSSSSSSSSSSPQPPPVRSREEELIASQALASLIDHCDPPVIESPQLVDTWLKCDESIDGLD